MGQGGQMTAARQPAQDNNSGMTEGPVVNVTARDTATSSAAAEIHETHTGIVILIGDRAFKIKKPVRTDFLDFTTVEAREGVCAHEVALNSRLAPQSYLGVGHFADPGGRQPPEPVVVMRRYPDQYRLRSMIERGEPTEQHLATLAGLLATFHARAARSPSIDECGTPAAITERWQENLTELDRHAGEVVAADAVAEVRRLAMRFLAGRTTLFATRITERHIVDGHGDLLTDDIFCTPEGPVPLDCLEFDEQLRYVDTIDDAAFLAMDLEFQGRPDLADFFLGHYRAAAQDSEAPRSLADSYIAYRAVVRAKVDCIRFTQGHHEADIDAGRHLDIALSHLRAATVRVVLVGGGPGTGKTTLATALAEALDAGVVSTDVVRRELQQAGAITGEAGVVNAGLYAPGNVDQVYEAALERAGRSLDNGISVILDGTWRDLRQRRKAAALAQQKSAVLVELVCLAELSEAQERIVRRRSAVSDATAQIASEITTGPWQGAHVVNTGRPLSESAAEAAQICHMAI